MAYKYLRLQHEMQICFIDYTTETAGQSTLVQPVKIILSEVLMKVNIIARLGNFGNIFNSARTNGDIIFPTILERFIFKLLKIHLHIKILYDLNP